MNLYIHTQYVHAHPSGHSVFLTAGDKQTLETSVAYVRTKQYTHIPTYAYPAYVPVSADAPQLSSTTIAVILHAATFRVLWRWKLRLVHGASHSPQCAATETNELLWIWFGTICG